MVTYLQTSDQAQHRGPIIDPGSALRYQVTQVLPDGRLTDAVIARTNGVAMAMLDRYKVSRTRAQRQFNETVKSEFTEEERKQMM
jgi:hypothetical protein